MLQHVTDVTDLLQLFAQLLKLLLLWLQPEGRAAAESTPDMHTHTNQSVS